MPHLITNASERQAQPLYPNKRNTSSMIAKRREEGQEKSAAIPKTYEVIKSPAGADMKPKGKSDKIML